MKHTIKSSTEHDMGRIYETLGRAINKLGWRIVKIKVHIDTQSYCTMTVWDNAPWWQFWRSNKQVEIV